MWHACAAGLAAQGVAVYRFDKRSFVFSAELAADKQITLEDEYLEDAVNAVQLLAGQERIDPERIFVLGHSLGGNAIPAVFRELEKAPVKACGFIMMAASPRPLDVLMREQYNFLYSLLPEVTAEQQAEKDAMFAELDKLQNYQVTLTDFGIWQDALGEQENWRMISYPGLTHVFVTGQKTEGSAVYTRAGSVDARVIQDIADFVNQTGAKP